MIYAIAALMLVASFFAGARVGWDYRDGKVAQEITRAQAATIQEANDNAVIDMEAARQWGERNAKARQVFSEVIVQGQAITTAAPAPVVCALSPERMRVLSLAVETANGNTTTPSVLRNAIDKANSPSK